MPHDSLQGLKEAIQPIPSHKKQAHSTGVLRPVDPIDAYSDQPKNKPYWGLDFSAQRVSPMDALIGVGQTIRDTITPSPDDPYMGGDPAGKAITMFSAPGMRKLATEAFVENAHKAGYNVGKAAEEFASKYPRVAAHIDVSPNVIPSSGEGNMASIFTESGKVSRPMSMGLTQEGRAHAESGIDLARNHVYHEGMHAAQKLGNSDMDKLYRLASSTEGYYNNPFEVMARAKGLSQNKPASVVMASLKTPEPQRATATRMLKELSDTKSAAIRRDRNAFNVGEAGGINSTFPSPAEQIQQILMRREQTPMRSTLTRDLPPPTQGLSTAVESTKKYPPYNIPELPTGDDAAKEIRDMVGNVYEGRQDDINSLVDMGIHPEEARIKPWSGRTITNQQIEPSSEAYRSRLKDDPEGRKWLGERGLRTRYDFENQRWIEEPPPDMSPEALQQMLRKLAD